MTDTAVTIILPLCTLGSPLLLALLVNRHSIAKEKRDNERLNEIRRQEKEEKEEVARQADLVARTAAGAAKLLLENQQASRNASEVIAVETAHARALLIEQNSIVAETARMQSEKLDEIHVLVNSNLTASMQGELYYARATIALLEDVIKHLKGGKLPRKEALDALAMARARVLELEPQLLDRLAATAVIESRRKLG